MINVIYIVIHYNYLKYIIILKNIKTISLQEACPFVYEVSLTYQGEFSGSFHTDAETQQRVAQVLQGVINVN